MSILDIILLGIILFGAYKGYRKGFLLEVISIIAFFLAIVGGFKLLHLGVQFLDDHFQISGELLPYISFILIFIVIILLVNLLGKALKKIIDLTLLGSIDNLAGALLSMLKWAFGVSVILWLSNSFGIDPPEKWTVNSVLYPHVLRFAPLMVEYFSVIMPFAQDLFEIIKDTLQGDSITR